MLTMLPIAHISRREELHSRQTQYKAHSARTARRASHLISRAAKNCSSCQTQHTSHSAGTALRVSI
eukprot:2061227-Rhodomonas_salina.2